MFTNRLRSNSYSEPSLLAEAPATDYHPTESHYTEESNTNDTQNWQEVNNRKRLRHSPETVERSQKQTKLSYWLAAPTPVPTSNSFAELEATNQPQITEQVVKPPPFFIDKVSNIQPLSKLLEDYVARGDYEIKILQGERVKIQAKSKEAYSIIYKELKNRNTEFFTYQPKHERSFRVVLKRIHHSTNVDEIKQALEELHHIPNNIWNIKNSKTKKPLPMFFVDLQPSPNNKDVYNIRSLLNCKIEVEPPRPKRDIPQCSNCQQYGHTQKFCHRQSRCVKCAGYHHTADCPRKERSDKVKCILCDGNHPANYKGCIVYKELQNVKFPSTYSKNQKSKRSDYVIKNSQTDTESKIPGKSYAATMKSNHLEPNTTMTEQQHMSDILQTFNTTIQTLMTQMLKMTQMITELMSRLPLHSIR